MKFNELNDIPNLQFIPVDKNKKPKLNDWQNSIKKHDLSQCDYVGLVCGKPSQDNGAMLEVVDIDCKYDLTGGLYENYKRVIHSLDDKLLKKIVVQKTRGGGYHFIYRCKTVVGNIKLARRHTTDEEKETTYKMTYELEIVKKDSTEEKSKAIAEKASKNDKVRTLLETRGLGGQIVVSPSDGYEFIYGDLFSISEISEQERDILFSSARQFNEYLETIEVPKKAQIFKTKGLSVFDDYNQRADVVSLLQEHGWTVVKQKGSKTLLLRPGQTSSLSSGNFDHDRNWFSVFTTSTEFDPEKAYLPYAVYAILECNKDFSAASKKLFELGYGERDEFKPKEKAPSTRVIPSRIEVDDEDYSFLATPKDYDNYLKQVRDGTLPQGLGTGSPALDEHFMFKEGELVMTNGHDNTGKSVFTWWLLLLAAMYHGWKGIIFSSENTLGAFMRKMIQFYWGKPLHGKFAMNDTEYAIAKEFIENHFYLIKAQEDLFNYKDIINMVKKARKKYNFQYGMIDPYNSLKIDLSGFSKLSTHEYHYEALSEIKSFGQQNNFGWFVNHHAVTAALRLKDGEKKYPVAPQKADTEGGGKVSNKADSFLTIHRVTQHPTDWMVTEVHVRKIKDTETGGRVTSIDSPVKFEMYKGGCAFIERREDGGRLIDPVAEWHNKREPQQQPMVFPAPVVKEVNAGWKPYKDDTGNEADI
jgi:hypothetical protein